MMGYIAMEAGSPVYFNKTPKGLLEGIRELGCGQCEIYAITRIGCPVFVGISAPSHTQIVGKGSEMMAKVLEKKGESK